MVDVVDDPSFHDVKDGESIKTKTTKKSGRRPIPYKWTRVISMDQLEGDEVEVYPIADNKDVEYELPTKMGKKTKDNWRPLFHPKGWWQE